MVTSVATSPTKVDLGREFPDYYRASATPRQVVIAGGKFISLEGAGRPGGTEFQNAVGAMYSVAYGVKFALKSNQRDFKVPPLEGLYWARSGKVMTSAAPEEMRWKLLIRVPDFVTTADVQRARDAAIAKTGNEMLPRVELQTIQEGKSVQVMHVGAYRDEYESIQKMLELMREQGLEPAGPHHEIYLSDPRRVPEARWRTILRLPVRSAK